MNNHSTSSVPPRWIDRLLEWFCSEEFLEVVQGDLHEMYKRNVEEQGEKKANLLYLLDVLSLFRPFTLGLNVPHLHLTTVGMYKSYLTTAFRNFRRQFGFSFINIFGLAVGMATFMIILTYVSFELSYDDYLKHKEKLYRLDMYAYDLDGSLFFNAATSSPSFKGLIEENMPEVKQVARLYHVPQSLSYINISYIDEKNNKISFNEENAFFADAAFLPMFDIDMMVGDTTALNEPNTLILSESTAKRYFGTASDDIIGQMLQVPYPEKNDSPYRITGIFRDLPPNTHQKADLLLSYKTLSEQNPFLYEEFWRYPFMYIYLQLYPDVTEEQFREKRNMYITLANERYQSDDQVPFKWSFDYYLVTNIHLQSSKAGEIKPGGNLQTMYFLFIVGILIIIIAWVNYVNLTTARAVHRAKEVSVRKVAGASRGQLMWQFLAEAFVINFLGTLFSFLIIWLSLPYFQQLTGKPLTFHLWWEGLPNEMLFFAILSLLFIFSTLLSGFYPALVLSSFKPLKTLKGKLMLSTSGGINLRAGLVVVQFTISVFLIAGTYLMFRQIEYMQNQPLGFDKDQMLVIQSPADSLLKAEVLEVFKDELLRQTFVEDVSASSIVPGHEILLVNGVKRPEIPVRPLSKYISIDEEFLDTYDITLVAGRNFSKEYGSDKDAIILNETLVNMLGFENAQAALHQKVVLAYGEEKEVIGIAKDFHQASLKEAYEPICFLLEDANTPHKQFKENYRSYISVKINTSHLKQNIKWIEEKFQSYFPGYPFSYSFLDERFNQQYKADIQFGKIFGTFAGLAIFIACLGIFGLSSYLAIQKSKEIGIRKVLGATVTHIVLLLSSKFMRLVMVATLIALPLAYFMFDRWLENYAFRIEIGWWFFVIPALVVFMIAILTISAQTVKAAVANPVKSLRHE